MQKRIQSFLWQLWSKYTSDRVNYIAGGLAFTTALALVPMLALWGALFKGWEKIQTKASDLLAQVLPAELTSQLNTHLEQLARNAEGMPWTMLCFVFGAGVFLFYFVEDTFNEIWNVRRRRGILVRINASWVVLTAVPLLVAGNLYVSSMLNILLENALLKWISYLLPLMMSWLAVYLAYILLPNARVHLRSAMAGSFVAAFVWELEKAGFNAYMQLGYTRFYENLYSSIVLVPLTLLWMYISWLTVLVGLEITFILQYGRGGLQSDRSVRTPYPIFHTLAVAVMVNRHYQQGRGAISLRQLSRFFSITNEELHMLVERLLDQNVLINMVAGATEVYVPGLPPDKIRLTELVGACLPEQWQTDPTADRQIQTLLQPVLEHAQRSMDQSWHPATLAELLHHTGDPPDAPPEKTPPRLFSNPGQKPAGRSENRGQTDLPPALR